MATAAGTARSAHVEVWELLRTLLAAQRRRFLGAAADLDLHPGQAGALLQLDSPLPMHELAELLACDRANVTGIVDRLEARGLVTRQADARDRRVRQLVLTTEGRRVRRQLMTRIGRPPAGLSRLSPHEQRELRDLLARVVQAEQP